MKIRDIKIDSYYRHKQTYNYGWAKVIAILKPYEKENKNNYTIVKCEWTLQRGDMFGLIKYFRPSDLINRK